MDIPLVTSVADAGGARAWLRLQQKPRSRRESPPSLSAKAGPHWRRGGFWVVLAPPAHRRL